MGVIYNALSMCNIIIIFTMQYLVLVIINLVIESKVFFERVGWLEETLVQWPTSHWKSRAWRSSVDCRPRSWTSCARRRKQWWWAVVCAAGCRWVWARTRRVDCCDRGGASSTLDPRSPSVRLYTAVTLVWTWAKREQAVPATVV